MLFGPSEQRTTSFSHIKLATLLTFNAVYYIRGIQGEGLYNRLALSTVAVKGVLYVFEAGSLSITLTSTYHVGFGTRPQFSVYQDILEVAVALKGCNKPVFGQFRNLCRRRIETLKQVSSKK